MKNLIFFVSIAIGYNHEANNFNNKYTIPNDYDSNQSPTRMVEIEVGLFYKYLLYLGTVYTDSLTLLYIRLYKW